MHLDAAIAPWKKICCEDFSKLWSISRIFQSCYWFIIFCSFETLFISDFSLWLSSTENKISKRFLLELHFFWMFLIEPIEPGVFLPQASIGLYVVKSDIFIIETLCQGRACCVSKWKVSFKYYCFGKLILLGSYLKITFLEWISSRSLNRKTNHIYDNITKQKWISTSC